MTSHKNPPTGVLPYEEREDEELMVLYANGEDEAFRELYNRYRARAYGYLSKRLENPSVVDELFQQVFLKLHRSREKFEPGRLFSTWFFTICRHVVIDEFRKQGRMPPQSSLEKDTPEEKPDLDEVHTNHLVSTEMLSDLSERQRQAIRMRYEEELAFDEIALKLGTTSANIRKLISRGLQKLKVTLGQKHE